MASHQARDLLSHDSQHALVVNEKDGAHVIEAPQTDLSQHFGLHGGKLALVQLESNLLDLLHKLPIAGGEQRRLVWQGDVVSGALVQAAETVPALRLRIGQKPELGWGDESRFDAKPALDSIDKHVDIDAILLSFEQMQRESGIEQTKESIHDLDAN